MEHPLQITSRNFELTDAIRAEITGKAEKLDRFFDRVMRCRVVVEAPHRHKHEGILFNVRVEMTVPGSEVIIKREPNEDLYVAIRDAFDAAYRKLEEHARRARGDVKRHETPLARIAAIFHEKGYGFLATPDDREIYFHKNSVINRKFRELSVGTKVRFTEELGEKGPQASTVEAL